MLSSLRRRIAAFISPDLADEAASLKAAMEDLAKYEEEGTYSDGYDEGNSDLKRANAETFEEMVNWLKRKGRTFDGQITAQDIVEELDHVFSQVEANIKRGIAAPTANSSDLSSTATAEITKVGRFGHHPDPADDFILEVQDIAQEWGHHRIGFANGTPPIEELRKRVARAMDSGPFITELCQNAKDTLRQVEREMAASQVEDIATQRALANEEVTNDVLGWLKERGLYDPRDYEHEGPDVAEILTEYEEELLKPKDPRSAEQVLLDLTATR